MNLHLEEVYLEAEADIRNNNYVEAFKKYESILYEEPSNGPTLNSLGWLYKTQLENYSKAESYYKAAIKANPTYPHPYINYVTLLTDMERFDELPQLLENCLKIAMIDKSLVYCRYGFMEELKLNFPEAIKYYERAILSSLYDDKIKDFQQHIDRCNYKLGLGKTHADWIEKNGQ
jgi:tetratricopeptide (TPR) repeat protein